MQVDNIEQDLKQIVESTVDEEGRIWLESKLKSIVEKKSTKDLFLTYSLIASKLTPVKLSEAFSKQNELHKYLKIQEPTQQELCRLYLLVGVTAADADFFIPKVCNIIQVADTGELVTFLKFLILLPDCEKYKFVAVDALRTNIAPIFDAIAMNNPYPGKYFDDRQWNQMYLKAAFMQRDLNKILDIDERANEDLSRIISDYAHERWAASREVDPYFWRPVGKFLNDALLRDMERLFLSNDQAENRAAALCCQRSDEVQAKSLLDACPELKKQIENNSLTWETLKD